MAYSPQAIRCAYDAIAEDEDRLERGHSLRNEIPREFIKKHLHPSDVVLDAGGGTGANAIMMAGRCRQVTLLDLSPRILELAAANIARAGLASRIDLVEGDITDLARFGDGTFSFVVCLGGALSYVLERAPQAVRELARVARAGATLVIGCDARYGFVRHLLQRPEHAADAVEVFNAGRYEAGDGAYARLYTPTELTELVQGAGCEVLEVASTPVLVASWEESAWPEEAWQALKTLELQVCTAPELLGIGHHLFCAARKV